MSTSTTHPAAGPDIDLSVVDEIIAREGGAPRACIPILQAIQRHFNYLPEEALRRVCEETDISPAQIQGVSSFYAQFRLKPAGEHIISVCHGTACHVAGAPAITEAVKRTLGIDEEQDTDAEGTFTVDGVGCLGCCALAPVMRIGNHLYGPLTVETVPKAIEHYRQEGAEEDDELDGIVGKPRKIADGLLEIRVGLDTYSMACGSGTVAQEFDRAIDRLGAHAAVRGTGSTGMYHSVPLVEVVGSQGRVRYGKVRPEIVPQIVRRHAPPRGLLGKAKAAVSRARDLLTQDSAWESPDGAALGEKERGLRAFLEKQKHIVLEGCGEMDPVDIDDYLDHDGYQALERVLNEQEPEDVIETIKAADLRGRGGGGFPTGAKWEMVRAQESDVKYVVLNGDEGDPGAFMDRMLLESYPHRVLEGLAIAAYAVGAREAYLYIRAEYPLALKRLRTAIRQAESRGYMGEGLFGTDFGLKLNILEGAGAFVCGEETGLLASLEGKRGMPRFRPPYPVEHGLWGKPTNLNNVETYACVPWIIGNGPEAFSAIGRARSKGTKVFALAGRIEREGLIEVPMGITIGEIVDEIGGGIRGGGNFKAVQIGGPSGGCLPASLRHVRIDYEELTEYGAMMGSGGLVVMDDSTCMVDVARYFLEFTQQESCGKCTFCRIGTKRMLEILERLCAGEGERGDIEKLEDLAEQVRSTSLCSLGKSAPNPILTTIRYFRDEYEAHIRGECPALSCREMIRYVITDECVGCTLCAQNCPADAIPATPYEVHEIDEEKCTRCGMCRTVCPVDAVEVE